MSEVKKTLFSSIYEGAEGAIKKLKQPLVERRLKRKFEAAHDDALRMIDDAELAIHTEREKLVDMDINVVLASRKTIKGCTAIAEEVKEEYLELFGEKLA